MKESLMSLGSSVVIRTLSLPLKVHVGVCVSMLEMPVTQCPLLCWHQSLHSIYYTFIVVSNDYDIVPARPS